MPPEQTKKKEPKVSSGRKGTRSGHKVTKPQHASSEQSYSESTSSPPKRETRAMARAKLQALVQQSGQAATAELAESSNDQAPAPQTQHDAQEPPVALENPVASSPQLVASAQQIPPVQTNISQSSAAVSQSPIEIGQSSAEDPRSSVPKPCERRMNAASPFREFSTVEEDIRWKDKAFDKIYAKDCLLASDDWQTLRNTISQFVSNVLPRNCSWESLDSETQAKLTALCPKAAMFVEVHGFADELFSAWIWRIIYDNLFSADCVDKWAGPEWSAFGSIQQTLRGGIEHIDTVADNPFDLAYFNTRHYTARMLYMRCGKHANPDRLAKIITKYTATLVQINDECAKDLPPMEFSDSDFDESEFEFQPTLSRVVEAAIRVDFLFVSSLRRITVEMHDPETGLTSGFPFRRSLMRLNQFSGSHCLKFHQDRPVDFICEPLVRSYGKERLYFQQPESWKRCDLLKFDLRCGYGVRFPSKQCRMPVVVDQFPESETDAEAETSEGSVVSDSDLLQIVFKRK